MHTILNPTDFTAESEQAFLIARGVARDQSAELIVLHVISPDCCREEDRDEDGLASDSPLFQSCWVGFDRMRALAPGIPVAFQIKVGPVVDTILKVAQRESCQLIVLTANHHCFEHHWRLGSIAEGVIRRSTCSVLCLRQCSFHQPERGVIGGVEQQLLSNELQTASPGCISAEAHSAMEGEPRERLDGPHSSCEELQSAGTADSQLGG